MPSQKLRLEAEMRDNASPAIRKLRQELADLQAQTSEVRAVSKLNKELGTLRKEAAEVRATPGMKAFGGWMSEAKGAATGFLSSIGGLPSALMGIGGGSLAAGAATASLAFEMKKLGERALDLKELSRELSTSTQYVEAFGNAGEHFGVGADAMKNALQGFAAQMPQLTHRLGPLYESLKQWSNLVDNLVKDKGNLPKQIDDILKQYERLKGDPQLQKQFMQDAFGSGELEGIMKDGASGFADELKRQMTSVNPISGDFLKKSQEFRDALIGFNTALTNFERGFAPKFLAPMTELVRAAEHVLELMQMKPADRNKQIGKDVDGLTEQRRKEMSEDHRSWWQTFKDGLRSGVAALHPMAYHPGSGENHNLLTNISFSSGGRGGGGGPGSPFGLEGAIATGTKIGIIAGLREMMAEASVQKENSGLQSVSFGGASGAPGGGAGGSGGAGGGSFGGLGGSGEGSKSFRNSNPGNIKFGPFAKAHGATGQDSSGFAIFPNEAAGTEAQRALWGSKYGNQSIDSAARQWSGGGYGGERLGVDGRRTFNSLSGPEKDSLIATQRKAEGWFGGGSGGGVGAGGKPVDIATALRGANESQAAQALGRYMHSNEWCADFVNGALAKAGGKGTNSALARSFFGWGHRVGAGDAQKGDVLAKGQHVGFATGAPQMHGGRMMIPMISGNHGHRVGEGWAGMDEYQVRRADGLPTGAPHPLAGRRVRPIDEPDHSRGGVNRDGTIRADIHVHGAVQKASVRSAGLESKLHRWPSYNGTLANMG